MGPGFGEGIYRSMVHAMIALAVCTFVLGVALALGLPWLWGILKPWLHTVTG